MTTGNTNPRQIWADQIITSALTAKTSDSEEVNTMLDKYGLNWNVSKQPLILPDGTSTSFFGIVREDTKSTFATCKEGYQPFQNSELGELLIRLSEKTGYNLHSGGSFNGGGKVFIQLESPNKIKGIGQNRDTVNGYLTGINSHDGSTSLKWGEANLTISCMNTFMCALKQLRNSARHTEKMHQKIELALLEIEGVVKQEKSLFDQFIKLSEIEVSKGVIRELVKGVTKVDIALTKSQLEKDFSTYALNRTQELLQVINSEMSQKGETLWGLFSGVTKYTTHIAPVPTRDNARLESLYVGSGFKTSNEAFSLLTDLVKS